MRPPRKIRLPHQLPVGEEKPMIVIVEPARDVPVTWRDLDPSDPMYLDTDRPTYAPIPWRLNLGDFSSLRFLDTEAMERRAILDQNTIPSLERVASRLAAAGPAVASMATMMEYVRQALANTRNNRLVVLDSEPRTINDYDLDSFGYSMTARRLQDADYGAVELRAIAHYADETSMEEYHRLVDTLAPTVERDDKVHPGSKQGRAVINAAPRRMTKRQLLDTSSNVRNVYNPRRK